VHSLPQSAEIVHETDAQHEHKSLHMVYYKFASSAWMLPHTPLRKSRLADGPNAYSPLRWVTPVDIRYALGLSPGLQPQIYANPHAESSELSC